jgi:uncharacterized linocin/CFP29 family protein
MKMGTAQTISAPGVVDTGRSFWQAGSGKWAGEQLLKALKEGRPFSPAALRTLDLLRNEDWKAFDAAVVEGGKTRLRAVASLVGAGLTIKLANAMATTVLEYDLVGDMNPATVSMDGMARSENDTLEWESAGLPIPIIHKDFFINLRKLMASRKTGEPLDTMQSSICGRKCSEELERMLFSGGKTFTGLPIYGLLTHPDRNTSGFGTNGAWSAAAKTGDNIMTDVFTMMTGLDTDKFYGPYWIWIPRNTHHKLESDYKAGSDKTIRQRLLEIDGIAKIETVDQLTADNIIMMQATRDVVAIVDGEQLQTVQWDVNGGFGINFKAFEIQVPLVRSDVDSNSGIFHMS